MVCGLNSQLIQSENTAHQQSANTLDPYPRSRRDGWLFPDLRGNASCGLDVDSSDSLQAKYGKRL